MRSILNFWEPCCKCSGDTKSLNKQCQLTMKEHIVFNQNAIQILLRKIRKRKGKEKKKTQNKNPPNQQCKLIHRDAKYFHGHAAHNFQINTVCN